jgi:putative tricarboxylic transport membrane protein
MRRQTEFVVHGPPGSAPPVMAEAFRAGVVESGVDESVWTLVPCGDDPGVDAMNLLARRSGDAYILSTCTPVFIQAPLLRGCALTHRRLTPLTRLVTDRFLVVVRAESPLADAKDFVSHIVHRKTRTGGYFLGGINHLLALSIAEQTGAKVEFLVVKSEPAVWTELIKGAIDWGCGVAAEILPHIEAGTLRPVAAIDTKRLVAFPDIPTLWELGVQTKFDLWRGLMGPADLSFDQQARWHAIAGAVRKTQAWSSYLARNNQADGFLSGEAFKEFLENEWRWYEKHLGLAGLLPQKRP